jgi:hypothetical protein
MEKSHLVALNLAHPRKSMHLAPSACETSATAKQQPSAEVSAALTNHRQPCDRVAEARKLLLRAEPQLLILW